MKLFDETKPFYKGNLHAHTTNSDGRRSPDEVMRMYRDAGYDFLAFTDHWKRTVESAHFFEGMLMLPGIELDYTLVDQVIHVVGINVDETILERADRRHTARRGIRDIRRAGGRAILAHPAWSLNTPEVIMTLDGISAAEIYNTVSGTPWNGDRADSAQILDMVAAHGRLMNTVASDDCHFYNGDQCQSFIMAQMDTLNPEGVNQALDRGSYFASRGPLFRQIEVTGEEIVVTCDPVKCVVFNSDLVYNKDRCVAGDAVTEAHYALNPDRTERFVRVTLIDENGRKAWANPIALPVAADA